jgi:tRNA threonylcarbamoyladenosine biosynthesis protein TsaE
MAAPLACVTRSVEETRALGDAVGGILAGGDVVALSGDLGAGKTAFVQGAARGLGVDEPVVSPTFTLVREYRGRVPVHHLDIYRLERVQDVLDLGLDDMLEDGAVVFVEWGDAIVSLLPAEHLSVRITIPPGDDQPDCRDLTLAGSGPSWLLRWEGLEAATERFAAPATG